MQLQSYRNIASYLLNNRPLKTIGQLDFTLKANMLVVGDAQMGDINIAVEDREYFLLYKGACRTPLYTMASLFSGYSRATRLSENKSSYYGDKAIYIHRLALEVNDLLFEVLLHGY